MTTNIQIFEKFLSGERINIESFCRFADYNTYLDNKLVRIYYVHRNKPDKQTPLDNFVSDMPYNQDEMFLIESVVSFISDYPNFWEFRKTDEYIFFNS